MVFSKETRNKIKDAILNYGEGITYIEFSIDNLDQMVSDIEAIVYAEQEALRREPDRPVAVAENKAKAPKVGSMIRAYVRDLNRSELMRVIEIIGNQVMCEFEDIEYCVKLKTVNCGSGDELRWEALEL